MSNMRFLRNGVATGLIGRAASGRGPAKTLNLKELKKLMDAANATGVGRPSGGTGGLSKTLTSGHIFVGNGSNVATDVALSGDASLANTGALTLANSGVTAASYGDSTHYVTFTVDAKGRLTAAASVALPAASTAASYHPGYTTGQYYSTPTADVGSVSTAINTLYALPFYCGATVTFTKASVRIASAISNAHVEMGLYANSSGKPGALLQDFGQISSGITGVGTFEITGLTITLTAGWYWLVCATDIVTSLFGIPVTPNLVDFLLGQSNPTVHSTGYTGAWTYATGTLPNPFPTATLRTGSVTPQVWLRF